MDELSEKRMKIEELKKEIERYRMSSSFLEAKKSIKNHQKFTCVCSALLPIISVFSLKISNMGYPFYVDNVNHYKEIETTIDEDGNIEEVIKSDLEIDLDISEFMGVEPEAGKQSNLYNYLPWSQTLTEESIRYIEKYSIGDVTVEEVADLLAKKELDLKSFGEPEIIPYTIDSEEPLANTPYMKIVNTNLSIDKESAKRNRNTSLLFILEMLIGGSLITMVNECIFSKKSAKRTKNEYNLMINQLEEEYVKLERSLK